MHKINYFIVSLLGVLAVVLGAFGAHQLKDLLSPKLMHAYETAVQYHFYHLFAMIFCIIYMQSTHSTILQRSFYFFLIGIICFSGSLYSMAFADLGRISVKFLGPITPVGGVFFIMGWASIFWSIMKENKK
jgi:uncharacterized membrane protein YgdD (TMEM256/DUF423 family)